MSALAKFIKEIDGARRAGRTTYPALPLQMHPDSELKAEGWVRIVSEARIALAALRKIRRVGGGAFNPSEEAEIAAAALKRIRRGSKS